MFVITAFAILHGGGAQTRRALLIGISAYDTQQTQWNPIHGTNDVALLRTALRHCGVADVTELRNADATYKGICLALEKLIGSTSPGDIVYLHMSGHGQPVEDYDGDEEGKDTWDEAFVPYDAPRSYVKGRYEGERHLTDDRLNKYIERLRSKAGDHGMVYVSIDACHAGDSYRDDDDDKDTYNVPDDGGMDFVDVDYEEVQPIVEWSQCARGTAEGFSRSGRTYSASDVIVREMVALKPSRRKSPLVVMESCLSTQRSYELRLKLRGKDFYCGPLSYIIYKVLRGGSAMLSTDVSWVRQVKRRFASALPANNPQRLVIETTQAGI